jgi:hypothetical protein
MANVLDIELGIPKNANSLHLFPPLAWIWYITQREFHILSWYDYVLPFQEKKLSIHILSRLVDLDPASMMQ